jgi:hypothetical protein
VCEEVDGQGTVEIREAFDKGNVAQKMNAVSYLNYKMVTVKQAKRTVQELFYIYINVEDYDIVKRKTGPLVRKNVNVESQNSGQIGTNLAKFST